MDANMHAYLKILSEKLNIISGKLDLLSDKLGLLPEVPAEVPVKQHASSASTMQICEEKVQEYWIEKKEPMPLHYLSRALSKRYRVSGSLAKFLQDSKNLKLFLNPKGAYLVVPNEAFDSMSEKEKLFYMGPPDRKIAEMRQEAYIEGLIAEKKKDPFYETDMTFSKYMHEYAAKHPDETFDMADPPEKFVLYCEQRSGKQLMRRGIVAGMDLRSPPEIAQEDDGDAFTIGALPEEMIAKQVETFMLE